MASGLSAFNLGLKDGKNRMNEGKTKKKTLQKPVIIPGAKAQKINPPLY
jgi:hypothetical protein